MKKRCEKMENKTIAVIYKSVTGNTKLLAEAIAESFGENVIYTGEPKDGLKADFYFIGSWTDKGKCCQEIEDFLKTLDKQKFAYFGTAGFGGSPEYYRVLAERVKDLCPDTCEMTESFFCQGRMPAGVRDRYVAMLQEHPDDKKLEASIKNFDEAQSHPDRTDLKNVCDWAMKAAEMR